MFRTRLYARVAVAGQPPCCHVHHVPFACCITVHTPQAPDGSAIWRGSTWYRIWRVFIQTRIRHFKFRVWAKYAKCIYKWLASPSLLFKNMMIAWNFKDKLINEETNSECSQSRSSLLLSFFPPGLVSPRWVGTQQEPVIPLFNEVRTTEVPGQDGTTMSLTTADTCASGIKATLQTNST